MLSSNRAHAQPPHCNIDGLTRLLRDLIVHDNTKDDLTKAQKVKYLLSRQTYTPEQIRSILCTNSISRPIELAIRHSCSHTYAAMVTALGGVDKLPADVQAIEQEYNFHLSAADIERLNQTIANAPAKQFTPFSSPCTSRNISPVATPNTSPAFGAVDLAPLQANGSMIDFSALKQDFSLGGSSSATSSVSCVSREQSLGSESSEGATQGMFYMFSGLQADAGAAKSSSAVAEHRQDHKHLRTSDPASPFFATMKKMV